MRTTFWLAGLAVRDFVFSHIVLEAGLGLVVATALVAILVPGGLALVRGTLGAVAQFLVRTCAGRATLACLVVAIATWEARGVLDTSVALRRAIETQRAADGLALAAEKMRTSVATAAAADARRQAIAQRAIAISAAARERASAADADDLAEQAAIYQDRLGARPATACRLGAADAADIARIGTRVRKSR